MTCFKKALAILAIVAPLQFAGSLTLPRTGVLQLRRLSPESSVCVNPPTNLTGGELDTAGAARDLAAQIRGAGFISAPLGMLESCDATVFTEVVSIAGRKRKNVEIEFRVVFSDEQIPRLCSSVHSKSLTRRDALLAAFSSEARQIRDAQAKGMPMYAGAVDNFQASFRVFVNPE